MGLILQTAPATEPVSSAEAKAHCKIEVTEDDTLVASLITAARQHVESYTRLALVTQTWDLSLDFEWPIETVRGVRQRRIVLPKQPVQSVTSITYYDVNGDSQTLAADQYVLAKIDTGDWVIDQAYGVTWPTLRDRLGAVVVRVVAGYGNASAVPQALKQAMLLLIGHWYEQRETVNVVNITSEIPFTTKALLAPYRVFY